MLVGNYKHIIKVLCITSGHNAQNNNIVGSENKYIYYYYVSRFIQQLQNYDTALTATPTYTKLNNLIRKLTKQVRSAQVVVNSTHYFLRTWTKALALVCTLLIIYTYQRHSANTQIIEENKLIAQGCASYEYKVIRSLERKNKDVVNCTMNLWKDSFAMVD